MIFLRGECYLNIENARKIVLHAVATTEPVWKSFSVHWHEMDKVFLSRAYEQGGFENWKFIGILEKYNISSIEKVGSILDEYTGEKKYIGDFARSLDGPFYKDLSSGFYGEEGKLFYKSVLEFEGWKGQAFWQLLWWMLICCNYLKNNYKGSFAYYLKCKFADFKDLNDISDDKFFNIPLEEWEEFKKKAKPWNELYGVSFNVFDFIMGDVVELKFVKNSYKLDAANERFLKVTGVFEAPLNRDEIIMYLQEMDIPYTLREINKGLYSYCADTVIEYGFCHKNEKCIDCGVNNICEKNF